MDKSDLNILIVEDDANFRSMLVEAVKKFGYRVTAVAKSDEALSAVKIKSFEAAIIDCMLPKMNGVDLSIEMRKTRFGMHPLILMSGIFKDKGFASQSIERTKAVQFLSKPFDILHLKKTLDSHLKKFLVPDHIPLHVLISKPFSSSRERLKVIEGLEELSGFDLPFVVCVLMEASANGFLNIVSSTGEIYGITFSSGKITNVDSENKDKNLMQSLVKMGFVAHEDLRIIESKDYRGDILQSLVESQFVSPHAATIVNREQIVSDLRKVFVTHQFNMNFVPERKPIDAKVGVTLDELTPLLHQLLVESLPLEYFQKFYQDWMDHPLYPTDKYSLNDSIFSMEIFRLIPLLPKSVQGHVTIEEICNQTKYDLLDVFRAIHLLTLRRFINFDEIKKNNKNGGLIDRIQTLHREIEKKNPFEIFRYFGVGVDAREMDVQKIFKEFSRANHPDLLPRDAAPDVRRLANEVFSWVSEAHDVLVNPEKKMKLIQQIEQDRAEIEIRAESVAEEAINLLRHGRVKDGLEKIKTVYSSKSNRNVKIAYIWAVLKNNGSEEELQEVNQILESVPHDERRVSQYAFVQGLFKAKLGDLQGAAAAFDRAIVLDPNFLEARREKHALIGQAPKKEDLLTGDLSKIVGNFFKKKR